VFRITDDGKGFDHKAPHRKRRAAKHALALTSRTAVDIKMSLQHL
jgi:hypothetical protein